jgi:ubiquinol-cytochrome c reductase cytochrome b subunit
LALGLQRKDRELVLHGHETGRIVRFESGEYIEVHEPLTAEERWVLVSYENLKPHEVGPEENEFGVRRKGRRWRKFKAALSRFYFEDRVEPVTPEELRAAQAHHAHELEEKANAEPPDPSTSHA